MKKWKEYFDDIKIHYSYYPEFLKYDMKDIYQTLKHELIHAKIYLLFGVESRIDINAGVENNKKINGYCIARFIRGNKSRLYFLIWIFISDIFQFIYDILYGIFNFCSLNFYTNAFKLLFFSKRVIYEDDVQ